VYATLEAAFDQHVLDGPLAAIHTHPTSTHVDTISANLSMAVQLTKKIEASLVGVEEKNDRRSANSNAQHGSAS
jgi:hypothetical protein